MRKRAFLASMIVLVCGCAHADDPDTAAIDTRDARSLCPALSDAQSAVGGGVAPSVGGEDVRTDLDALAASLPTSASEWRRTQVSTMARGAAGHWSPVVMARYETETTTVVVEVTDLVHVCTCEVGMGRALRDTRGSGARAFEISGHPASDTGRDVTVWINDRCTLCITGAGTSESMMRIADAVDFVALAAACPARP